MPETAFHPTRPSPAALESALDRYRRIRRRTVEIAEPLRPEDCTAQPVVDVSPPKWHLGHTTWFFEQFLLDGRPGYEPFDPSMAYVFNSYYETVGERVPRDRRGCMTRPALDEVLAYRRHVDERLGRRLEEGLEPGEEEILELGLNHEEQHQELLVTDLKYILGHNPLHPAYGDFDEGAAETAEERWFPVEGGRHDIGFRGEGFCFDNELARHTVHLEPFAIRNRLVTNGEYLGFVEDGGYRDFRCWHADAWDHIRREGVAAPMYWRRGGDGWNHYTLPGLRPLDPDLPLAHVSFYEAFAFCEWAGWRLPTEFEWEAAAGEGLGTGLRWEWTHSAYLPYPGYTRAEGALGEYNGKFMVNQMVLRGASVATAPGHSRITYRNFFHPHLRWQYSGIRPARR